MSNGFISRRTFLNLGLAAAGAGMFYGLYKLQNPPIPPVRLSSEDIFSNFSPEAKKAYADYFVLSSKQIGVSDAEKDDLWKATWQKLHPDDKRILVERGYEFSLASVKRVNAAELFDKPNAALEDRVRGHLKSFGEFMGVDTNFDVVTPEAPNEIVSSSEPIVYLLKNYVSITQPTFEGKSDRFKKVQTFVGHSPIKIFRGLYDVGDLGKLLTDGYSGSQILINLGDSVDGREAAGECLHHYAGKRNIDLLKSLPESKRTHEMIDQLKFIEEGVVHAIESMWLKYESLRNPSLGDLAGKSASHLSKMAAYAHLNRFYNQFMPKQSEGQSAESFGEEIKARARQAFAAYLAGRIQ